MALALLPDLWDESFAAALDEPDQLKYRSNLLGSDLRLTNFGGGNTSAKVPMTDPITGEEVIVLWVKGSGGDLGTMGRDGFATLYLDRLLALRTRYAGAEQEDAMAELYPQCTFGGNPRAASIDTPLHGFLPFRHVDHLHPDWAIALAASANGPAQLAALRAECGVHLAWLPWRRPGFELALWLERCVEENAGLDGIVLGSHGLFTWGDTSRACYLKTLQVIDAIGQFVTARIQRKGATLFGGAAVTPRQDRHRLAREAMPRLRGLLGPGLVHYCDSEDVLQFVGSRHARELAWQGTSCPDHFVRTKVRPLFVEWESDSGSLPDLLASVERGVAGYREDYAAYYNAHRTPNSPPMRSANPTVVLVPGVGMFSVGRTRAEARITGEFYTNAIHVMAGATAMDDLPPQPGLDPALICRNYVALPPGEAFNIEYWALEEAKLKRLPPEKELARRVAVVVGASPGIGFAVAERLAREGAHVAVADLNAALADECAAGLRERHGKETALALQVDATDRAAVREMLGRVVDAFGGVDILVSAAAIFCPPGPNGRTTDEEWRKTYEINLTASMILADEAHRVMQAEGSAGSIVLLSSANAVVAKKGSWAYDTAKAALNHLVREMAVEFAPKVRINAVAPATVVEGSQQFGRERVLSSLRKYGIPHEETEQTEELRARLSAFYAERTLLKRVVRPADVAEAVFLLVSTRLGATTGQVLPVDAGLPEAFLR